MALGLPVILFTGYVQYVARVPRATPTLTPRGTLVPSVPQGTMAPLAAEGEPARVVAPHVARRRARGRRLRACSSRLHVLRALGIGPVGSLLAAGKLQRATDSSSRTSASGARTRALGDVVERGGAHEARAVAGRQILSPAGVAATLRRMQRPPTARVDLALAREIAEREGVKAVVDGDVTPLGAGYVLTLRLVTADSGIELASFHGTANGPEGPAADARQARAQAPREDGRILAQRPGRTTARAGHHPVSRGPEEVRGRRAPQQCGE